MDDGGLIRFLVIAFFVIASLMDGAARKRRKQAQEVGLPPEPNRLSGAADDPDQAAESSEGFEGTGPADLWEEITAMARGEVPTSEEEPPGPRGASSADDPDSGLEAWTAPQQDVPQMRTHATEGGGRVGRSTGSYVQPDALSSTETRSADLQAGYLHPDQAASHEEHAHEKHAEAAVTAQPLPEERPHEFVPHPREEPSKPQKKLGGGRQPGSRSLLAGVRRGSNGSLQEAIILAEVLSPPVTLRDSGWKPLF
jgi:hypothetical protein